MQPRQRSKCVTISGEIVSPSSWPTRISTIRPRGESISSSKSGVGRARRQAEAAVHAVLDELRLGRTGLGVPGGRSDASYEDAGAEDPGRVEARLQAVHDDLRRRRPPATARDAAGAVEHGAVRGASAWRAVATRARGVAGSAIHDSPSAARETTVASARRRGSRPAGRSGGRRPSAPRRRRAAAPRTLVPVVRRRELVADAARGLLGRGGAAEPHQERPRPSAPGDVEASRPPAAGARARARARAARPGRRARSRRSRCGPAAGAGAPRPTRSARACRRSPRTASPGHSPRRS